MLAGISLGGIKMKIKKYTTRNGQIKWEVSGYLGIDQITGRQVNYSKKGISSKKEAQLLFNRALSHFIQTGTREKIGATKSCTVQELYDDWIESYRKTVADSTFLKTTQVFKNHILPAFGKYRIHQISARIIEKQVEGWSKNFVRFKTFFNYFNRMMTWAFKRQLIAQNPCLLVTLPRVVKKKKDEELQFYSKKELLTLLKVLKEKAPLKWYCFFHILAYTGLRKGELLALQWKDISFTRRELTIDKSLALAPDNIYYVKEPKNQTSERTIILDDGTVALLKKWKIEQAKFLLKSGHNALGTDQLVFSKYISNTFLNFAAPRNYLYKFCQSNGFKFINIHGFRHTHASLLFESGASIKEVQDRLGHSDQRTTLNIYIHVTELARLETGNRFAKYMEKSE